MGRLMGRLLAAALVLLAGSCVVDVGLPALMPPPGVGAPGLAGPAQGSLDSLTAVTPIPAPGWVRRIPAPRWPLDLAAHMNPSAVTNQCVAGALATWALVHAGDPRWNHPPALAGNAIDLLGLARIESFEVSRQPAAGSMVVYGGAYGLFGHVATVLAVERDRYEVVEQNFLDFSPDLESHWQTFDERSAAWPDPAVTGFIVSPP
jgi:hypothetical protein